MRKMTVVMSRTGLSYECYYCKEACTAQEADTHECATDENEEYIDYYAEAALFGWDN